MTDSDPYAPTEAARSASAECYKKQDYAGAIALLTQAWENLPSRDRSDYHYQTIPSNFVTVYQAWGKYDEALKWVAIKREIYLAGPNDPSFAMLEGGVHYQAGDLERAYACFDIAYKGYKKRPFQGKDPKYLAFYLEKKA